LHPSVTLLPVSITSILRARCIAFGLRQKKQIMQRKLILIGILLSITLMGIAQNNATLSGYIRDESTGEELIGATIQVQGTSTGTVTNAYGFYSLTLQAGTYRFVVSYVGYNPYIFEMNLTGNQTLNFQLKQEANELEEVVVKGEAENSNVTVNQMSVARLEPKLVKECRFGGTRHHPLITTTAGGNNGCRWCCRI
jgi:hypothetical protein